jgi:Tol biopolymer transport system component
LRRLTTGSGDEAELSCTPDTIAFTNLTGGTDVWSIRFDPNAARTEGSLERLVEGPAIRNGPSLSEDGRYVAFASSKSGRLNIWTRDLTAGKEAQVT